MAHTGDTDTSMPGQSQASPVDKPDTTIPDHAQASPADKADDHDANDEPDKDYAARFKEKVRRKRIERGLPVTPEFANFPLEEGASKIHASPARMISLHPGGKARKSGRGIELGEADALRVAEGFGLPVPHVHYAETTPDGVGHIWMDYVPGDTLSEIWPSLSEDQKMDMARQTRAILEHMRSIPPPEAHIGSCEGGGVLDMRNYTTHSAPACRDEKEFNDFLLSGLLDNTPPALGSAFSRRLRTNHRVVFTHGDLRPSNIMVRDGKIVALLDFEVAGWYPEYWEYVKCFQREGTDVHDWWRFMDTMFPETYGDELVDYVAISTWQYS